MSSAADAASPARTRTIVVGSDHGGFELKEHIKAHLEKSQLYTVVDVGTHSAARVDYPDFARLLCAEVASARAELGVIVCGTGIGVSIACNKVEGIRCALAHDHYTARMARQHNDANVLSLGGRVTGVEVALDMVSVFLSTAFGEQQHTQRVKMLNAEYMSTPV